MEFKFKLELIIGSIIIGMKLLSYASIYLLSNRRAKSRKVPAAMQTQYNA